ncbi:unnamed protein product [Linum trigynum]|uniref:Uncharacterized protein n=1 Tax=Linum trigynum TaxID=586398 RepID=A0AAV2GHV2_9ROSI
MELHKEELDLILVPLALVILFSYNLSLLYRYLNHPHTTAIGFQNNDKIAWVERIMEGDKDDIRNALSVISSNTSAASVLASISLTLSSLIGAWLGGKSPNVFQSELIYGDTRSCTLSMKYIGLMLCFLLAFSCFVSSATHFVHANYLISIPSSDVPVESVETAVIRAGDFWCLGLRALYFALNLLMWFFGPVPMFVSAVITVAILCSSDTNSKPLHQHLPAPARAQMVKMTAQPKSPVSAEVL